MNATVKQRLSEVHVQGAENTRQLVMSVVCVTAARDQCVRFDCTTGAVNACCRGQQHAVAVFFGFATPPSGAAAGT